MLRFVWCSSELLLKVCSKVTLLRFDLFSIVYSPFNPFTLILSKPIEDLGLFEAYPVKPDCFICRSFTGRYRIFNS
jgi:hypothetical protein